jgi:hypothetical protein
MTDEQMKELAELRVAIQDLKYQLIQKHEKIEDRESAIYATGYWNGIQKAKEKNETLDTRSYLIGRYDGLRELSDEEISQVYKEVSEPFGEKRLYEIHDFARAILKKAGEK